MAAADAVNALGIRHELVTEAARVCCVTSLANCLHYKTEYTATSLGVSDRGLMTRPVSDRRRSWSQSLSYTFVFVVRDKALCDMIMLKCNKSCDKCRNSAKRYWP